MSAPKSEQARPASGTSVLSVKGVAKRFGATIALRDADLQVVAGEIHAVLGENGSGKSTLVKLLSGIHRPDAGSIEVAGADPITSPRTSKRAGIATAFQEVLVVESQNVLNNVLLGLARAGKSNAQLRSAVSAILSRLLIEPPSLDALVEDLDLSVRQACVLARAILSDPTILILDEATSALDHGIRTRLFVILRELVQQGKGIILITHRLDEIEEIADRLTVLRSGRTVGTFEGGGWDRSTVIQLMTGAENLVEVDPSPQRGLIAGELTLAVGGMRLAPGAVPINFELKRGEIVGLAGLEGQGQDLFIRRLWFGDPALTRMIGGRRVGYRSPHSAGKLGLAYVPRDRQRQGLFHGMSVLDNFVSASLWADSKGGWLSRASARVRLEGYRLSLGIKYGNNGDSIATLSGGNAQKVVIARWLTNSPEIILLNDPTRGIDIGAKRELYSLVRSLADGGAAVVMLSTEVDELVELMDRVLVFRDQSIERELPRESLTRPALVASFFGESATG